MTATILANNARFLRAAMIVAALATFMTPAVAQQQEGAFEAYLAEMNDPSPDYIAVSNHFRHSESGGCTADGCVLMGPTSDRDACERWAAAYNRLDEYDHTRCIEAPATR